MIDQSWWNSPIETWIPVSLEPRVRAHIAGLVAGGAPPLLRRLLRRIVATNGIGAGAGYFLGRLAHVSLLVVAAFVAIVAHGAGLSSLTPIARALGFGCGPRTIAGNFIAVVIRPCERPIRPGRRISAGTLGTDAVGQARAYVCEIGLGIGVVRGFRRAGFEIPLPAGGGSSGRQRVRPEPGGEYRLKAPDVSRGMRRAKGHGIETFCRAVGPSAP